MSTKKMRPAAQDLHKGSQNLHAALKCSAKAGPRVKGVRLEDGPGWMHFSLSISRSPAHRCNPQLKDSRWAFYRY